MRGWLGDEGKGEERILGQCLEPKEGRGLSGVCNKESCGTDRTVIGLTGVAATLRNRLQDHWPPRSTQPRGLVGWQHCS